MQIIAHIIDTDTIEVGNLIAWELSPGREIAGSVVKITDHGTFIAHTLAFGKVEVTHEQITDIC
jgi:hypothetical protein